MAERLTELYNDLNIKKSGSDIDNLIHLVVHLANKDVKDFATATQLHFIKNTWSILPESNQALRFPHTVTTQVYRKAVEKMEKFLRSLTPEQVFHSHKNVPEESEMEALCAEAEENMKFAVRYSRIHLYEITLLECLAQETGGETALSLLEGDPSIDNLKNKRIEDRLPKQVKVERKPEIEKIMHKMINGKYKENLVINRFYSPLAAFLYNSIGEEIPQKKTDDCIRYFEGQITSFDFLKLQHENVLRTLFSSISSIATIRTEAIEELAKKLNLSS